MLVLSQMFSEFFETLHDDTFVKLNAFIPVLMFFTSRSQDSLKKKKRQCCFHFECESSEHIFFPWFNADWFALWSSSHQSSVQLHVEMGLDTSGHRPWHQWTAGTQSTQSQTCTDKHQRKIELCRCYYCSPYFPPFLGFIQKLCCLDVSAGLCYKMISQFHSCTVYQSSTTPRGAIIAWCVCVWVSGADLEVMRVQGMFVLVQCGGSLSLLSPPPPNR